uniref:Prefoldin subunit 4 n=1 Tax=Syphacia muris TaxID=451379 RepID=A0A0N5AEA2_9BILA
MSSNVSNTYVNSKVQVTADDQKMINKFARLHQRFTELKVKSKEMDKDIQNFNDAADELLLLDDNDAETVPFKMGTIFDTMNQKLENLKESTQKQLSEIKEQGREISSEMDVLKKKLYGKFGNKINLETDKGD